MKNKSHTFFAFAALLFVSLGCGSFMKGLQEAGKPQVMTSTDGTYQLTVPGNWTKQTDLNSEATLQAANPREELYVIVIKEDKKDFPSSTTVDDIADFAKDNLRSSATDAIVSASVPATINGYTARKFDASGKVSGIEAKYIYAVVETRQAYYQVMTWSIASKYEKGKTKLQDVINSFKEIK